MRRFAVALLLLYLGAAPARAQEAGEVTLKEVKYEGLKQAVLAQRGKVVLVDFWGFF